MTRKQNAKKEKSGKLLKGQRAATLPSTTNRSPQKTNMIVLYLGSGVKSYQSEYIKNIPKTMSCPVCQGECQRHGWYRRIVRESYQPWIISLLRVQCKRCGRTHSVIPDYLRPRSRYSQHVREPAIVQCIERKQSYDQATKHGQAVETTRRWVKAYKRIVEQVNGALRSIMAQMGWYDRPKASEADQSLQEMIKKYQQRIGIIQASSRFGLVNILLGLGPPLSVYL